jgi:hypothetical protein
MPEVNVDLMTVGGQAQGQVAHYVANNGKLDIGRMRPFVDMRTGKAYVSVYKGGNPKQMTSYSVIPITNATLRRDEWKQLDDAVLDVSRERLGGIQDLIDKGLTFNLGNAMGTTVLEWHDVGDAMTAEMTMDGISRGKGDRLNFQHNYLPIPIVHVDYEINARVLAASRNMGNPLDTTSAERAARKILEKLETNLFTDTSYSFGETDTRGENTIYSYLNHPDRNLVSIGTHWDDLTTTIGATIVNQVLSLKETSISALHYGPWMLYIPTNYEVILDQDYSDSLTSGTTNTIRDRILKIAGISGIKVIDTLPDDNVLLVQMTKDVVRLVRGLGLQNIQWGEEGNMVTKFKVLTIQVPQIRSDQNKKSGIVHLA